MKKLSISFIGTGALGGVMARAAAMAGFPIKSVFNRSIAPARKLAGEIGAEQFGEFPRQIKSLGKLIFLTVPDRHIEGAAEKLAGVEKNFDDYFVAHCSGNKPSAVLHSLQKRGAAVAAFHPIQTFSPASTPADFRDIFIDIEGDNKSVDFFKNFAAELGCTPMEIAPEAKPYLHAAAVMASNYLVALLESAGQMAEMGGIDGKEARGALMPLVQKNVSNIARSDKLLDALSGPISRGDSDTVADHLKLLESNPPLATLYRKLGQVLIQSIRENGRLPKQKINELFEILDEQ